MKWLIKNPAPWDARLQKWGDYHFGRSVAKWLVRLGQEADSDYAGQWGSGKPADVVLVLRGRQECRGRMGDFQVMWIISHPEEVAAEEFSYCDLVFTASRQHAEYLEGRVDAPVFLLPQCVDADEFRPLEADGGRARSDFVFVGNTREERRESVLWAVEAGLPLKVWGRGWERWIDPGFVAADYIDNRELPRLYSTAKVTFNDHWPDMRRWNFVNNRLFDAVACGLPVISDHHDAAEEIFKDAVLFYRDRREFNQCLERLLLDYPGAEERARAAAERIREEHSFERRVRVLLDKVKGQRGS